MAAKKHSNPDDPHAERKPGTTTTGRGRDGRFLPGNQIASLGGEAKNERAFRSIYAEAFVASLGEPVSGEFETPHGNLSFKQEGNRLLGEGKFEEPVSLGLLPSLSGSSTAR